MLEDEKKIIERAVGGEASAFGLLYDYYLPKIYRFVLLKVSQREEAEDLTHQAFLKAWESIAGYTDMGFPFGSWLYQISRNVLVAHYRHSARLQITQSIEDLSEIIKDESETLESHIERKISLEPIAQAVREL